MQHTARICFCDYKEKYDAVQKLLYRKLPPYECNREELKFKLNMVIYYELVICSLFASILYCEYYKGT